jgi:hypothetical protein
MHLGRRYIEHFYGAEHTAVRQIFLENLFPLSSIVSLASEFLLIFLDFAYSGLGLAHIVRFFSGNTLKGEMPGRITLESFHQPHGYEEGGHICFTLRFAFLLMSFTIGRYFGVGLRRRLACHLFRLPDSCHQAIGA